MPSEYQTPIKNVSRIAKIENEYNYLKHLKVNITLRNMSETNEKKRKARKKDKHRRNGAKWKRVRQKERKRSVHHYVDFLQTVFYGQSIYHFINVPK